MHMNKENWSIILACIVEVVVGILLLIDPIGFTSTIIVVGGVVLLVNGVVDIVQYFRTGPVPAAVGQQLAKGLLETITGLFCILNCNWFLVAFPVITVLYGVANLISGLFKTQLTVDAIRLKAKWGWSALSAVVTLALAVIILLNPFSSTAALWVFTAVTLIAEAIVDLISIIFAKRKK